MVLQEAGRGVVGRDHGGGGVGFPLRQGFGGQEGQAFPGDGVRPAGGRDESRRGRQRHYETSPGTSLAINLPVVGLALNRW